MALELGEQQLHQSMSIDQDQLNSVQAISLDLVEMRVIDVAQLNCGASLACKLLNACMSCLGWLVRWEGAKAKKVVIIITWLWITMERVSLSAHSAQVHIHKFRTVIEFTVGYRDFSNRMVAFKIASISSIYVFWWRCGRSCLYKSMGVREDGKGDSIFFGNLSFSQ